MLSLFLLLFLFYLVHNFVWQYQWGYTIRSTFSLCLMDETSEYFDHSSCNLNWKRIFTTYNWLQTWYKNYDRLSDKITIKPTKQTDWRTLGVIEKFQWRYMTYLAWWTFKWAWSIQQKLVYLESDQRKAWRHK